MEKHGSGRNIESDISVKTSGFSLSHIISTEKKKTTQTSCQIHLSSQGQDLGKTVLFVH